MVTLTIPIVYCPTYIYRKGWLTNRLSLLIILNLVSESSAIRTLFSISPFAADLLYAFPKWILLLSSLLPHHQWCSTAGQPSTSCCRWCLSSTTSTFTCRACLWFFLLNFCRSFAPYGNTHSSYRSFIKHPPSFFVETYKYKLSLLANADEALSPWSRCFSLRWWLSTVSSILCFWQFCWFFLYN